MTRRDPFDVLRPLPKSLDRMKREVYENNFNHGWFKEDRPFSEDIALLTTEVGEAFDAYRDYGFDTHVDMETGKPDDVASELADILIRLLDTCYRLGLDLEQEYERKMAYNRTRPYRHGNKKA